MGDGELLGRGDLMYVVNEVFYSLQGEGAKAGTAAVFLRFSGCNSKCSLETHGFDCDTEYASGQAVALPELVQWVCKTAKGCRRIVLTGGEPALQVDKRLVQALRREKFLIAIETNGSTNINELELDWITVSPKVAEHAVRQLTADEVKYVRCFGQSIPSPRCIAPVKLISPAFRDGRQIDKRTLRWCVELVKDNPEWRLSVQQHKLWGIR